MSSPGFLTSLDVRTFPGRKWITVSPLLYQTGEEVVVFVPRGFVSDFASTPYIIRGFLPRDRETAMAAVLHDWLYKVGHLGKRKADRLFREALLASGVSRTATFFFFNGVYRFGGFAWSENRNKYGNCNPTTCMKSSEVERLDHYNLLSYESYIRWLVPDMVTRRIFRNVTASPNDSLYTLQYEIAIASVRYESRHLT